MTWLSTGADPHRCALPGWRERRRMNCKLGARWRCDECGVAYAWTRDGYDGTRGWGHYYDQLPPLPKGPAGCSSPQGSAS